MASCQISTRLFGCCLEARSKVGQTTRYQIRIQDPKHHELVLTFDHHKMWNLCTNAALASMVMGWRRHMGSPLIDTSDQIEFDKIENHWTWVLPWNSVLRLHSSLYCSRTQQHHRLGTYLFPVRQLVSNAKSGATRNSFGPSVYEESQHAKPQLCRNGEVTETMPKRCANNYKQYRTIKWIEYPQNSIVRQVSTCVCGMFGWSCRKVCCLCIWCHPQINIQFLHGMMKLVIHAVAKIWFQFSTFCMPKNMWNFKSN